MADTTAAPETAMKAQFGADNFHSSAVILGVIKSEVIDLLFIDPEGVEDIENFAGDSSTEMTVGFRHSEE